ncbi:LLM class flavin-dependent oxidoreductase [Rhizobium sp. NPDC090275]|uniref:LLM class flavin-dependent oxidoreductase n=1 Tax=Rhizobium sp. NPDC090275 TaxID=3364498 RepID=UPI00383B85AA
MNGYLELGLFLPSTKGGLVMARNLPSEREATWGLNKEVVLAAEASGMEFALSQVKWRGYGGESGHWDGAQESFTLMAGLAAVTSKIKLIASVAVRTINPAVAAKMAATIDDIADGRFALNIVAGWNKFEYAQMGLWSDDDYYLNRYDYADEYLTILRRLWTEDGVTFDGKYFKLEDCRSNPKPKAPLKIVSAGQSEGALAFVARHSDYSFIGRMNDSAKQLGELARKIAGLAADQGRSVTSYTLLNVVAGRTHEEAEARKAKYMADRDEVAIEEWLRVSGFDKNRADYQTLPPETTTFMSVPYIVGSHEKIAAHLDSLAQYGVGGVALCFPDFEKDVPDFIANVLPRMASRQNAMIRT